MKTIDDLRTRLAALAEATADIDVHERIALIELIGWLDSALKRLATATPSQLLHTWSQIGMEDPDHCTCDDELKSGCSAKCAKEGHEFATLYWMHQHHREWNTILWRALKTGPKVRGRSPLSRMRAAARADLKTDGSDDLLNERDEAGKTAWGRTLLKEWCSALVDGFLVSKEPKWCDAA